MLAVNPLGKKVEFHSTFFLQPLLPLLWCWLFAVAQKLAKARSFCVLPFLPRSVKQNAPRARAPDRQGKRNSNKRNNSNNKNSKSKREKEDSMLSAETGRTPLFSQGGGRSNRECLQSTPFIKKWGFTRPPFCSPCCLYFGVGYLLLHRS